MNFEEFLNEWHNDRDFIIAHTSGSTGHPKEIKLNKKFVEESARRTNAFFKIKENSRLHSCVGADFIGGKMMAVRASISNAAFSYEIPSNHPLKDFHSGDRFDLIAVVPSQVFYILDNLATLPRIENLLIGGSSIHPDLREKIAKSGLNAYESYGMTETASHIALRKITEENNPFTLLPDIKISLDKDNCLKIQFKDGSEIQTNDIAELINEKEFFIKGRRDQVIISGGKKINLIELETKVSDLIPSNFLFTGIPDEKWGEKLILLIEGNKELIPEEKLKEGLKNSVEKWEIPKEILYIKTLPKTPNGKIKRIKDLSVLSFSEHDKGLSSSEQNKQVQ